MYREVIMYLMISHLAFIHTINIFKLEAIDKTRLALDLVEVSTISKCQQQQLQLQQG